MVEQRGDVLDRAAQPGAVVSDHDPVLAEVQCDSEPETEVALLAEVTDVEALPPDVRVLTRFGDVVTLRAPSALLPALAAGAAAVALEAAHGVVPPDGTGPGNPGGVDDEVPPDDLTEVDEPSPYRRRPDGLRCTGRGVVVAGLDWGLDVGHAAFRREDGSTRLLALWDQRGGSGSGPGNRWGYGRVMTRADIDAALQTDDPYAALDYHPADADAPDPVSRIRSGAHGSHVLDIAAGTARAGGSTGVAPEADLVFVHLARTTDALSRGNLGDSVSVLEALDFVLTVAGDRPVVVNLSVGAHGGPKDASTLVERGIDEAVGQRPGLIVCCSAGNYARADAHRIGRLRQGGRAELCVRVPEDDPTRNEIEVWYSGADVFTATVVGPDGSTLAVVRPGADAPLAGPTGVVGHAYHVRATGNRQHHLDVFLRPRAPGGIWRVRLDGHRVTDGRYRASIERERGLRPRFVPAADDPRSTTGTLCNGRRTITVGAYDPHGPEPRLARFSSWGPTADGRTKPELVAPGARIRAARSTPRGEPPGAATVLKSGTSMAAPHVTGLVALMLQAAGDPLDAVDVRALLLATSVRPGEDVSGSAVGVDVHGWGAGVLDMVAAEQAARRWPRRPRRPDEIAEVVMDRRSDDEPGEPIAEVRPPAAAHFNGHPVQALFEQEAAAGAGLESELSDWELDHVTGPEWVGLPGLDPLLSGTAAPDEQQEPPRPSRTAASAEVQDVADQDGAVPALAEQLLAAGGGGSPAGLRELALALQRHPPDAPLALVAAPRAAARAREGDLLVRSAPAQGVDYLAVVVGRPEPPSALAARGVPVEAGGPGLYVEVVEVTSDGSGGRQVARRLSDPWGRSPAGQTVLGLPVEERTSWRLPRDSSGCGVPARPPAELEQALDEELLALAETPAGAVAPRLSLYQNSPLTSHRNHFHCQANRTARRLRAYAGRCSPLRAGPSPYDTGADILALVADAHACLHRRLQALHVFGHSGAHGLFGTTAGSSGLYVRVDPASRLSGARAVSDVDARLLAEDVVVVLHGCNTAAGSGSFAEVLFAHLAASLDDPRVYGHPNSGCAGRDDSWREFSRRHPSGRAVRSIAPHYSGSGCCEPPGDRTGSRGEAVLLPTPRLAWPGLEDVGWGEDTDVDALVRQGLSENHITNQLFSARHPQHAGRSLTPGTRLAAEWITIRDRVVRPAVRQALPRDRVDLVSLATFLSQYEDSEQISDAVKRRFLLHPAHTSLGRSLRDRVLANWSAGRPPLTPQRLYAMALDLAGDAPNAMLLCHNVTRAFVRGGRAIYWQGTGRTGEYTDGHRIFTAERRHPAGVLRYERNGSPTTSIIYLLFDAREFGTEDPGDWYHFFVTATMAVHGAAGGAVGGGGTSRREEEDRGSASPGIYRVLLADVLTDLEQQLSDPALRAVPGYRGWVLANVLSFVEGAYYGREQAEVDRESAVHLRGAVFGLRAAGGAHGATWRWHVPRARSVSRLDLARGVDARRLTASVLPAP